jgi:hypothetical protein
MPMSEIPFSTPSKHWSAGVSEPPAKMLMRTFPAVRFSISLAQASPALACACVDGKKML